MIQCKNWIDMSYDKETDQRDQTSKNDDEKND